MIAKRIKWGIHPDTKKAATSGKAIITPALPQQVVIPVRQHIGAPAIPIVKKGDLVKKGQLIAKTDAPVSSYIHASISGKVVEIADKPHPVYGEGLAIVIENDGLDEWEEGLLTERDWKILSNSEIIDIIRNAGIVGMGGAAFPSHIKLNPPKDKKVDTLIINAAECEPFLTVDHRVILEYTDKIVTGIQIIQKLLSVDNVIIGIEDNKMNAVIKLKEAFSKTTIRVEAIQTRYPQGAEKMIIQTLTGREIEPGKLPIDIGVIVQNVSTAIAICDAVTKGLPLIERVVTLSGKALKEQKNLSLRIGTTFADAIELCGGLGKHPERLIMGGPMMGMSQYTTQVPVIKGTSGILALSKKDVNDRVESACLHCGKCVDVCPMGLNPSILSILGEKELIDEALKDHGVLNCIECGCCGYSCPSKRKIVHYIKYTKKLLNDQAANAKGGK
ncbi:MAG: electron transporter RnfC [Herbinix sp.]|nr:electron transporter RnfC [Herbinix sp.]